MGDYFKKITGGVILVTTNVLDDKRVAEIWLTNAEKRDEDLLQELQSLYKEYHDKKYLVAVFMSGERDLAVTTSNLLCYNRKHLAEIEAKKHNRQSADAHK